MATILCVDHEPGIAEDVCRTLASLGHTPLSAPSMSEALRMVARGGIDVVVAGGQTPGAAGPALLAPLRQAGHDVPVVFFTDAGGIERAVSAIRSGAVDYVVRPVGPRQLELAVARALEIARLRGEIDRLRREVEEVRAEAHSNGGPRVVLRSLNVDEAERVLIRHALEAAGQNRTRAAELLGISIRTLRNKLNNPATARA